MNIPTTNEVIARLKSGAVIPKAAMFMAGDVVVLSGKESDAKTVKVHLKARSKDPINHWWFGKVVHDFGSARIPSKIALDDTHGDIPIGHGRPSLTEYGLEIDGVVTPDAENAQHPASMMAHALKSDIPMQASIDFCGDYDVMEVPDGATVPINGKPFTGPGCVIMNWGLRATAICKAGADSSTETHKLTNSGSENAPAPKSITQFAMKPVEAKAEGTEVVPTKPAEAQKAVEAKPVVEPETQLTAEALSAQKETELRERLASMQQTIDDQNVRLNALSKPAVAPIPGVSQEKPNKMSEPTTWREALTKTKGENPTLDAVSILRLAAKKYPTLNNVGWRSPEAQAKFGVAKEQ